ncbi:MAG: S16 family serine protease [Candidatus Aenigmatarchaeota archaeon]
MKKNIVKLRISDLIFIVIIVFLIGFLFGLGSIPKEIKKTSEFKQQNINETIIEIGIPAVDSKGNGVVGKLETIVRPGTGLVLVNINNVLAQYDTQYSGRVAAKVASEYTKTNMSNLDVIYNIKVNASIVEGPSAGASMALSIILALENKKSNPNVMITGTINEDGTIGPVGAIYEKALAAKNANATIFLVPQDQSTQYGYKRERECKKFDFIEYCSIKYIAEKINIGESLNITVKEVRNIDDAVKYFIQNSI